MKLKFENDSCKLLPEHPKLNIDLLSPSYSHDIFELILPIIKTFKQNEHELNSYVPAVSQFIVIVSVLLRVPLLNFKIKSKKN
jgi:hypothetical protein